MYHHKLYTTLQKSSRSYLLSHTSSLSIPLQSRISLGLSSTSLLSISSSSLLNTKHTSFSTIATSSAAATSSKLTTNTLASIYQYRNELFEQEWQKYQNIIKQEQENPTYKTNPLSITIISPFTPSVSYTHSISSKYWRPVDYLKQLLSSTDKSLLADLDMNPIVGVKWNKSIIKGLTDPIENILYTNKKKELSHNPSIQLEYIRLLQPNNEGKRIYWHSAAHILGSALELNIGNRVQLCDGPSIVDAEGGFFYEFFLQESTTTSTSLSNSNPSTNNSSTVSSLTDITRINQDIFPTLEITSKTIIQNKYPYERLRINKLFAIELFKDNPFKLDLLYNKINTNTNTTEGEEEEITVYRCGNFIDLCRGPHLPHTGYFKTLKFYRTAGSRYPSISSSSSNTNHSLLPKYTLPQGNELLHRIYGISFPTNNQLQQWETLLNEAKKRDHRIIGNQQKLFFFHDASPGSAFLLPHGTRIYNRLVEILRTEYRIRGYEEVQSPLIYKQDLWKTSGHLQAYGEDMFRVLPGMVPPSPSSTDSCSHHTHATLHTQHEYNTLMGLKPMNCPGHCLIFAHRQYSYRELPVRLADFSSLHRNEATGALGGLTRLRRFAQDDAHIFCSEEHITQEVMNCLEFVANIYRIFGFSFRMRLSTRPDVYIGDLNTWDNAETALRNALESFLIQKQSSSLSPNEKSTLPKITIDIDQGGGAFYGPKVDVFVKDAIGREHQCATVQLDFQLPKRFNLSYRTSTEENRTPVIIHRAILGSIERMLGILIEHTAGKWPFWLSPRQILLCTVADRFIPQAKQIKEQLQFQSINQDNKGYIDSGLWIEIDDSTRTIPKKIREGQLEMWNILAVIGEQEIQNNTLALRFRDSYTYETFINVWKFIDPVKVDEYLTKNKVNTTTTTENKVNPSLKKSKSISPNKEEEPVFYNSPLISLPIDTVKQICERMIHLRI